MNVTVIGLGAIGAGVATSTLREGLTTTVWNRSPEKAEPFGEQGATVATDLAEAVRDADVVISALFDEAATHEVLEQALPATQDDVVWLQSATVGPAGAKRLDDLARQHDRTLVDAPVLGTKKPAQEGKLTVLVAGTDEAVEKARPVLDAIGVKTVELGSGAGEASALKLACNSWVASITASAAQAISIAQALDVDPGLFLEAIDGTAVDTPYAQLKGGAMISGDFTPSFGVDGVLKDLDLMLEATDGRIDQSVLAAVRARYGSASDAGHGADDMASVVTSFVQDS